jgi:putative glutamine amidotransferase
MALNFVTAKVENTELAGLTTSIYVAERGSNQAQQQSVNAHDLLQTVIIPPESAAIIKSCMHAPESKISIQDAVCRLAKPLIAIPGRMYQLESDNNSYTYSTTHWYVSAVVKAGGIPVIIMPSEDPPSPDTPLFHTKHVQSDYQTILNLCGGVLLQGGPDIHPSRYGEQPLPANGLADQERFMATYDFVRDQFSMPFVALLVEEGVPVIGICRGAQELALSLGGRLGQSITNLIKDADDHLDMVNIRNKTPHRIKHLLKLDQGSEVYRIIGQSRIGVNSFHHQFIILNGKSNGYKIAAKSRDGVIEIFERSDFTKGFLVAIQGHPEIMKDSKGWQRVFKAHTAAAYTRQLKLLGDQRGLDLTKIYLSF